MITQAPRGTKDWFWKRYGPAHIFREYFQRFMQHPIIFTRSSHQYLSIQKLFQRGVGETTDVVQKEMYTFEDKGHRSISLKPEGTAGAIRAYLQNGLANEPQPIKMFYTHQHSAMKNHRVED